ncbi:MAG: hypothetical protein EP298_11000 [Gammaproteobacteria bacterium]|nr:MAG: hypothetical protein EP298_11000 [Gammaproteobacteria bacterium]UTW41596.1 hypothetical protein KFE69_08760 [bacterium SCSIO 12844]
MGLKKFSDFIKSIKKGQLEPENLQYIGKKYYKEFDNWFSRLNHNNFDQADILKNYTKPESAEECCYQLIKISNMVAGFLNDALKHSTKSWVKMFNYMKVVAVKLNHETKKKLYLTITNYVMTYPIMRVMTLLILEMSQIYPLLIAFSTTAKKISLNL